jgi:hypothetical protein
MMREVFESKEIQVLCVSLLMESSESGWMADARMIDFAGWRACRKCVSAVSWRLRIS